MSLHKCPIHVLFEDISLKGSSYKAVQDKRFKRLRPRGSSMSKENIDEDIENVEEGPIGRGLDDMSTVSGDKPMKQTPQGRAVRKQVASAIKAGKGGPQYKGMSKGLYGKGVTPMQRERRGGISAGAIGTTIGNG